MNGEITDGVLTFKVNYDGFVVKDIINDPISTLDLNTTVERWYWMAVKKKTSASAEKELTFTKEALVNSKRFRNERDIVFALLKDGVEYTISEVETMIEKYMKGKVK